MSSVKFLCLKIVLLLLFQFIALYDVATRFAAIKYAENNMKKMKLPEGEHASCNLFLFYFEYVDSVASKHICSR